MKINITKKDLSDALPMPTMAYNDDQAGIDLYSSIDVKVSAKSKYTVPTGIIMQCHLNMFERLFFKPFIKLFSRSGLSSKFSLECGAGVIDADYIGEVHCIIYNHGHIDYDIRRGDKICQAVPYLIPKTTLIYNKPVKKTDRGIKGFGSSGK